MANVYWSDVEAILAGGVNCMANVVIATDQGVFEAKLDDYETVKRLHEVIATAINAWARDEDGQWEVPFKKNKPNAMPPSAPLKVENVDRFLAWVEDGMPEAPAVA